MTQMNIELNCFIATRNRGNVKSFQRRTSFLWLFILPVIPHVMASGWEQGLSKVKLEVGS